MYFSDLIVSFDIFAISGTVFFAEQLEILQVSTNYIHNCIAVSSEDNPSILSGKPVHGRVALFWKKCFNMLVKPLENIDSDRIVGIRCDFGEESLFILGVYMPASSHCISGHYTIQYPLKVCDYHGRPQW